MSAGASGGSVAPWDLTEDDLAKALGIDVARIRAYERGTERVPSEHMVRLSELMEVPLSYFFPTTPCPSP